MTNDPPPRLLSLAATQDGVFTTAQALGCGLDRYELDRWANAGRVLRLRRGAYALREVWSQANLEQRHLLVARAVLLSLEVPGVLSHGSAAVASGLRHHGLDLDDVHVTHRRGAGTSRREAGVRHHRALLDDDEKASAHGFEVTSEVRTALDLARSLPGASALVTVDHVLSRGATPEQLRASLFSAADRPGARGAGRVVAMADGRSESVGETLGRHAFSAVGHPPDVLQLKVATDRGEFRTDYAWTAWGVVGEFDGQVKYGRLLRPGESASDVLVRERQRELAIERAGRLVVRFTWAEVHDHELVRARLLEVFHRSRSLGYAA